MTSKSDFSRQLEDALPALQRYALKLTRGNKDRDAGKDLLQDTAERMLARQDEFRGDARLTTWGCSIMFNILVSGYRKQSRCDKNIVRGDFPVSVPSSQESVVALRETREQMKKLSDQEQKALVGTALGMSDGEIGAQEGMPSGTVRAHRFRARDKLRAADSGVRA